MTNLGPLHVPAKVTSGRGQVIGLELAWGADANRVVDKLEDPMVGGAIRAREASGTQANGPQPPGKEGGEMVHSVVGHAVATVHQNMALLGVARQEVAESVCHSASSTS